LRALDLRERTAAAGNPDTGKKIIAAVGVIAVGGAVVLASSST
jgi:hypothetical protein